MPLIVNLKPGEAVRIGAVLVTHVEKSGERAKLVVAAPDDVVIERVGIPSRGASTQGVESVPSQRR
jgi:sRNA-binding carbon storage regulator CsrA